MALYVSLPQVQCVLEGDKSLLSQHLPTDSKQAHTEPARVQHLPSHESLCSVKGEMGV